MAKSKTNQNFFNSPGPGLLIGVPSAAAGAFIFPGMLNLSSNLIATTIEGLAPEVAASIRAVSDNAPLMSALGLVGMGTMGVAGSSTAYSVLNSMAAGSEKNAGKAA